MSVTITTNSVTTGGGAVYNGIQTFSLVNPSLVISPVAFTGIPSWVKRITVIFYNLTVSNGSNISLQIGSGSFATSGYTSGVVRSNSGGNGSASSTSGFLLTTSPSAGASAVYNGCVTVVTPGGLNYWVSNGVLGASNTENHVSTGSTSIFSTLDRIQIIPASGYLSGGSVNIFYE